ncbi:MAG: hypothetical protein LUK37_23400, partial [Clostridia bacterium]|nr:hypothetical protein [Clostridia bacterium]
YWGHCDIDVIWGDLSKFYPDELIRQYDRFLIWGHLTLYKNTPENNEVFKKAVFGKVNYKTIISSRYNWGFDEYRKYALLRIQEKMEGYEIYRVRKAIADISPWNGYQICDGGGYGETSIMSALDFVRVESGAVYVKRKAEDAEEEKAYIHFQKRGFNIVPLKDTEHYYVLSNTICLNKDYVGRTIVKKDNRKLKIKLIQCGKLLEIITSKYK